MIEGKNLLLFFHFYIPSAIPVLEFFQGDGLDNDQIYCGNTSNMFMHTYPIKKLPAKH